MCFYFVGEGGAYEQQSWMSSFFLTLFDGPSICRCYCFLTLSVGETTDWEELRRPHSLHGHTHKHEHTYTQTQTHSG